MKTIDTNARRAALARTQIFQALQPSDIDLILARAAVRRVSRGDTVLRRGDPGSGMVVIMSGRVRVSVISEDGKEVTLSVLGVIAHPQRGTVNLLKNVRNVQNAIAAHFLLSSVQHCRLLQHVVANATPSRPLKYRQYRITAGLHA